MKLRHLMFLPAVICLSWTQLFANSIVTEYSHEELMKLGETMYREGILPSGKPMKALVMGDIPFDGRMFTCDDCHQRSGLGSEEGTVITWPTNGKELYAPRRRTGAYKPPAGNEPSTRNRQLPKYYQVQDVRPPYTDKSLARVLRTGIDPAGRKLDPIMPKYGLNNKNMPIMVYYLKHLSVDLSPGVNDTTLQFATIVSDAVSDEKKAAMLQVLQKHIDTHNSLSRHEKRRAAAGPFYKSERHMSYRTLNLDIWELQGAEDTWPEQLERYYKNKPVFALLGGITDGSWENIHKFSEKYQLPCIFPVTELPVISTTDWYTLYFSKGYYQEGETAAKFIRAELGVDTGMQIVQVFRAADKRGSALAKGFSDTWKKIGGNEIREIRLTEKTTVTESFWKDILTGQEQSVVLLWVDQEDKEVFSRLNSHDNRTALVFISANLLGNDFALISDGLKEKVLATYPYSLPNANDRSAFAVKRWLEARKIPVTHFDIQAKMYFLGWMLPGALKSMRSEFYRDYFLERYDMMIDQDYAIAVYPRLTFGTGQRYASKGCYIVKLGRGIDSKVTPVSDWVVF